MNQEFSPTKYTLKSFKSGKEFDDAGWMLDAPNEATPTLIRAIYDKKQIAKAKETSKKKAEEKASKIAVRALKINTKYSQK